MTMNALKSIVRFCRVTLVGRDDGEYPIQQVEFLGKVGEALMWFPYGIHANIPPEYLCLMLTHQGNRESRTAFPGSPQNRDKSLPVGEVVFYHPLTNSKIHFKTDGSIEIVVDENLTLGVDADTNITIDGDANVTVEGDTRLVTAGDVDVDSAGTVTIDAATLISLLSAAAVNSEAPSTTIGNGVDDIVALMAEMCQLVHDSEVEHSGSRPMDAATKALWVTLQAKVLTLA